MTTRQRWRQILRSRPHPEQGFRAYIGILGLSGHHGAARVDAACARALVLGTRSYTSIATIMKNRQHQVTNVPVLVRHVTHEAR